MHFPEAERAIAGLELTGEDVSSDDITRALLESGVYMAYGLPNKARACLEKLTAKEEQCYEARRQLLSAVVAEEDDEAALAQFRGLYELAMNKSDHKVARACLLRTAEFFPDDQESADRLAAFQEAMGESEPADEEAPVAEELSAPGETTSSLGDTLETAFDDLEAELEDGLDDFDFDDEEMAKLAAELGDDHMEGQGPEPAVSPPAEVSEQAAIASSIVDDGAPDEDDDDDEESFDLEIEVDDDDDDDDDDRVGAGEADFGFLGDGEDEVENEESVAADDGASGLVRGRSLFEQGDYAGAVGMLQQALEAEEDSAEAMLLLGRSLLQTGEVRGSVDMLKKLLASRTADTNQLLSAMFHLAESYEAAGNPKGAYKIYKRIVDQKEDFADGEAGKRASVLESQLRIN